MPDESPVRGEEAEILFLGLHEEKLVKGISMGERGLQLAGGVTLGQAQEGYVQPFESGDHLAGIEGTLALPDARRARYFSRISQIDTALTCSCTSCSSKNCRSSSENRPWASIRPYR